MTPMSIRTYSELITIPTFEERYEYLMLSGSVGVETFGFERYLNQSFYISDECRSIRRQVIIRDIFFYLASAPREIYSRIIIHHMNPITKEDLLNRTEFLLNPEYLVCTMKNTHDAIHYGDKNLLFSVPKERQPHDTCPWRR